MNVAVLWYVVVKPNREDVANVALGPVASVLPGSLGLRV